MNKIILIGNLVAEPEFSVAASGVATCRFRIAVNRRSAPTGEERQADFFRVITFRKTAENCNAYLTKGKKVCVIGALQIGEFTDKENNKRTSVEVLADEVEFLSPRGESSDSPSPLPPKRTTLEPVNEDSLPF